MKIRLQAKLPRTFKVEIPEAMMEELKNRGLKGSVYAPTTGFIEIYLMVGGNNHINIMWAWDDGDQHNCVRFPLEMLHETVLTNEGGIPWSITDW